MGSSSLAGAAAVAMTRKRRHRERRARHSGVAGKENGRGREVEEGEKCGEDRTMGEEDQRGRMARIFVFEATESKER